MAASAVDPLFEHAIVEDPHEYYAHLREHDPVHLLPGTGTFLVTRLDLLQHVVADVDTFSSNSNAFLDVRPDGTASLRDALGDVPTNDESPAAVLATADPPLHTHQRRILSKILSTKGVAHLEAAFRNMVDETLDCLLERGRTEWMADIAEPLPAVLVARLLGLPDDLAPRLKDIGFASVEQIGGFIPDEQRPVVRDLMIDLGPVADAFMSARAGGPTDLATILGVCVEAVASGDMDDLHAISTLMLVVAAGTESTTSLLGTGARLLAQDPALQDRLRSEPGLIPTFVDEACRVEPPFRGHYRRVTRDTTLHGVPIPAGSRVVLVWPAANRDPAGFSRPDTIDLDRAHPRHHVGFGWGIHLCIGAPLARLEARVVFERLLARTSSITIDEDTASLSHHRSLMIRRLECLPLVLRPS